MAFFTKMGMSVPELPQLDDNTYYDIEEEECCDHIECRTPTAVLSSSSTSSSSVSSPCDGAAAVAAMISTKSTGSGSDKNERHEYVVDRNYGVEV